MACIDLKISHMDPKVVSNVIEKLKQDCGKVGDSNMACGKLHDYLSIKIDFTDAGKVILLMEQYIDLILQNVPGYIRGTATSLEADHLFEMNENSEFLDEKTADLFHHITAQLIFLCKRARPDIQTAVSFLCTKVQCLDTDDYKKLTQVIRYLRQTRFIRLTLEANGLDKVDWYVDGAFSVHDDMRSHTGSCMTLGKGLAIGNSTKKKINTTSSIETEVVAVHDTMSSILWTSYFLRHRNTLFAQQHFIRTR